ncbi:MAG TPA: hypothetical protein VNL18_05145 [Gemmatimonadales bacterium]|nr:hypothetical protein [Gemmatimonadales bacterium]
MALATLALLGSGCALSDLFEAAGARDVVFQYTGPTQFRAGDRAAFSVAVRVAGQPLPQARLFIRSLDTNVVAFTAGRDSLVARRPGQSGLRIWLEDSFLTGDYPDTTITLRVQGGGPAANHP